MPERKTKMFKTVYQEKTVFVFLLKRRMRTASVQLPSTDQSVCKECIQGV